MSTNHEPKAPEVKPGQRCYVRDLELTPELQRDLELICQDSGYRKARDQQRVEDEIKLQYYFGGLDIAYLVTPRGPAVVAAGDCSTNAYREALDALSPQERQAAVRYTPRGWHRDVSFVKIPFAFYEV